MADPVPVAPADRDGVEPDGTEPDDVEPDEGAAPVIDAVLADDAEVDVGVELVGEEARDDVGAALDDGEDGCDVDDWGVDDGVADDCVTDGCDTVAERGESDDPEPQAASEVTAIAVSPTRIVTSCADTIVLRFLPVRSGVPCGRATAASDASRGLAKQPVLTAISPPRR